MHQQEEKKREKAQIRQSYQPGRERERETHTDTHKERGERAAGPRHHRAHTKKKKRDAEVN
jgi:hypothetical protein